MSFENPEQNNLQEQALTAFQELRIRIQEAGNLTTGREYQGMEPEVLIMNLLLI